jgi:CRP/FNR family transcriptional regulator
MKSPSEKILALGKLRHGSRGTFLFQAEEKAGGFYYIQSGEVRVFKVDENGRELEVARIGPGDFLGEAIAFAAGHFPFYGQAVKDTKAYYFDRNSVLRAVETDAAIAKYFIELLARKCVLLSSRVESLGLKTVRQKLIQYLLSNCQGSSRCFVELKIKKGELAIFLGTISETLSRNLRQMRNEGLIEVHGPSIHIKDCQKLRAELAD